MNVGVSSLFGYKRSVDSDAPGASDVMDSNDCDAEAASRRR